MGGVFLDWASLVGDLPDLCTDAARSRALILFRRRVAADGGGVDVAISRKVDVSIACGRCTGAACQGKNLNLAYTSLSHFSTHQLKMCVCVCVCVCVSNG